MSMSVCLSLCLCLPLGAFFSRPLIGPEVIGSVPGLKKKAKNCPPPLIFFGPTFPLKTFNLKKIVDPLKKQHFGPSKNEEKKKN